MSLPNVQLSRVYPWGDDTGQNDWAQNNYLGMPGNALAAPKRVRDASK
jgi:hypothetical protein